MNVERIIGSYTQGREGPLIVCLAGIHGNEHAGVEALRILFTLLENEPRVNAHFQFQGKLLGIAGNLKALRSNQRYIQHDLNRLWTPAYIQQIQQTPDYQLANEAEEIVEILQVIQQEIAHSRPSRLVVLDLHTTTATGGIFTIATDDPHSVAIGAELHAPVIKGLMSSLKGTTLHYFNSQNLGLPTTAVTFESGQHHDPLSVNRAIAATINCLRTTGCVNAAHVENRHDALLIEYSRGLPKIAELIMRHPIQPGDGFVMEPGYRNFQPIKKGTLLAKDKQGPIYAPEDGSILMPLYQKQGDDGFFLIRTVEAFAPA